MQTSLNEKARGPSSLLTLITPTGWCPSSLANIKRYYKSNFTMAMVRRLYIELVNWDYKPFRTPPFRLSSIELRIPWPMVTILTVPARLFQVFAGSIILEFQMTREKAQIWCSYAFIGWPLDIPFTVRQYLAIKMNQA